MQQAKRHVSGHGTGAFRGPFSMALAAAAIAAPTLLPIGRPPLNSLYTEATALLAWGLWLAWLIPRLNRLDWKHELRCQPRLAAVLAIFALALLSVILSVTLWGLPWVIGLRHGGILLAAITALLAGARVASLVSTPRGADLAHSVLLAFLIAGVGSAVVCVLQYTGIEGFWEPLGKDGRAGGNLAQPNLLGTQLLWAYAAVVGLRVQGRLGRWTAFICALLLLTAVAMSASRSAMLSSLLLSLWGLADRRLSREARLLLLIAPAILMLAWTGLQASQALGGPAFAGSGLLQKADPTSSRWRLWQQCAVLIASQPWFGVGWGQFNFAWSLTPMPNLPRTAGYTFGHAHNLLMHWAVELGLPLAVSLAALLAFSVLGAARRLWRPACEQPAVQRAALAMVLIVLMHSLFELPLWHTNFLLPTAFLLGLAVAEHADETVSMNESKSSAVPALLVALAAAFVLLDYRSIAEVYNPPPEAPPLEQRIDRAQKSVLFGGFADRFAGTLALPGKKQLKSYRVTVFELLDWRLLASWAQAYTEAGQVDKARYLAARLREFDGPGPQAFFAICSSAPDAIQCAPNLDAYRFSDFR